MPYTSVVVEILVFVALSVLVTYSYSCFPRYQFLQNQGFLVSISKENDVQVYSRFQGGLLLSFT